MDKNKIEANHYDIKVLNISSSDSSLTTDFVLRKAHLCYETSVKKILQQNRGGLILDYGCGIGIKNFQFTDTNWKIIGIDISSKSIEIAKNMAIEKKVNGEYMVMDCEKMSFSNNSFDLIIDYGTFSSLDIKLAIPELLRVLKKDGVLVAIETFGHNPITNIKRKLNVLKGKRTSWAENHIMKLKNWKYIASHFKEVEIYYFGFFVLFLSPFIKRCPNNVLTLFERLDELLFKIKIFQKLAFKTVVVLHSKKDIND